jgi:hypothetical protein
LRGELTFLCVYDRAESQSTHTHPKEKNFVVYIRGNLHFHLLFSRFTLSPLYILVVYPEKKAYRALSLISTYQSNYLLFSSEQKKLLKGRFKLEVIREND